ncbi:hypothetical protein [Streptomyces sp. NPDC018000]
MKRMTHLTVLGSANMDLVAYVPKPPRRGEAFCKTVRTDEARPQEAR